MKSPSPNFEQPSSARRKELIAVSIGEAMKFRNDDAGTENLLIFLKRSNGTVTGSVRYCRLSPQKIGFQLAIMDHS